MRVAVAGATGLVGRHLVMELREAGHEPVLLSRSTGFDLLGGDNLGEVLRGVEAVVDVTNTPATDPDAARAFFAGVTGNLLDAAQTNGVRHHVVLSIVGVDRVEGNGHYAGKRLQEEIVGQADVPATVVRATQFFEFAQMLLGWTRRGAVRWCRRCSFSLSHPATSHACSPTERQPDRSAEPSRWQGPSRKISSTWPGVSLPLAARHCSWSPPGVVRSAPRWQARLSSPEKTRSSRLRPSSNG